MAIIAHSLPVTARIHRHSTDTLQKLRGITALAAMVVFVIAASSGGLSELMHTATRSIVEMLAGLHHWMGENPLAALTMLIIAGVLYALLLSLPFVPGLELGFALMVVGGTEGVLVVYLSTLAGMALAFSTGRRLRNNGMSAAAMRATKGAPLYRVAALIDRPPVSYLITAFLINCPGNSVLGGGGGIAMLSGCSRSQTWGGFLFTVAVAAAPIPFLLLAGFVTIDLCTAKF